MPRILQLPVSVITKIAAGEVIERPASVVKELLENSVDAGATRIEIDIEDGGAELIRVVDDGHGIHPDDMPLAFANHATSKLTTADDLFAVRTMGFRGEALASIGGVAQVTLQSRSPTELIGAEVSCHGGELSECRAWNGRPGTRIEVRHLFFNTPVRRKFLRTAGTEIGHICETVTRLALAKPGLHLTLRHNEKHVYDVPGDADLLARVGLFFGDDVKQKLYGIEESHGPTRLFGYIADPSCERGNARTQYLFLNGRWIRDRSLGHALQEAYRGLLMTGRYAVAFLFLEMPPAHVDVNVHPTKAEVRFRESQPLYSMVLSTIRRRLSAENLTARLQPPSQSGQALPWLRPVTSPDPATLFSNFPAVARSPLEPASAPPTGNHVNGAQGSANPGTPVEDSGRATLSPVIDEGAHGSDKLRTTDYGLRTAKAIQLHNAYLVLETPEGMLVIDQHALHERILFEQLKDRFRQGALETQNLLTPEPIELTAEQAALVLEHRQALAELGLGVEDFGGTTILVTSYPAVLSRRTPGDILRCVVDHLTSQERAPTREQLLGNLMSLLACHAAVRAGDPLSQEEIAALLAMRHLAGDAHHCPHGRPTALLWSRHDLDRQFRRV